jgi:hypothetical protein
MDSSMNYFDKAKAIEREAIKCISPLRGDSYVIQCINNLSKELIKIDFSTEDWLENIPKSYGIYLFWVNLQAWSNDVDVLNNEWVAAKERVKFAPRFNQARSKKTRLGAKNDAFLPFYLGKTEKLADRVKQHVFIKPESGTYALKLGAMRKYNKKFHELDFYISHLEFPFSKKTTFLLEIIEAALREKLNPVIGRQ